MASQRKPYDPKVVLVEVTKDLAKFIADLPAVPGSNSITKKKKDRYIELVKDGQFRDVVHWVKVWCEEKKMVYRVNGKYTADLFAKMDEIPAGVVACVEYRSVRTMREVVELNASFDNSTSLRPFKETNHTYAKCVPDLIDIPNRMIDLAVSGMSYATWLTKTWCISTQRKASLLWVHPKFVKWASDMICSPQPAPATPYKYVSHMVRQAVVAAMLLAYRDNEKAANTFWLAVRDGTGGSPSYPDRRLKQWLDNTTSFQDGAKAAGNTKLAASSALTKEMYIRCTHAWESWKQKPEEPYELDYRPSLSFPQSLSSRYSN